MKKYHINDPRKISKLLKKTKNVTISNKIVEYMYEDINTLSKHIKSTTEENITCEKGCAYCCYTKVELSAPEAFYIYSHLKSTLNKEQLNAIFESIKQISEVTSIIPTQEEHARLKLPCIFLHEGMCSIYDQRPFICREYHSVNMQSCEQFYSNGEKNTGAVQLVKIIKEYYNLMGKYEKIYKENNLVFEKSEFLSLLTKIHYDDSYKDNYFKNKH